MRRAVNILVDVNQVEVIKELTAIFESIASIRIAQVKGNVTKATAYFNELWGIYSQLRVDPEERFAADETQKRDKMALVVVTSEGGLSGDIDQRTVNAVKKAYNPDLHEVIVVGSHGGGKLRGMGVNVVEVFKLPDTHGEIPKVTPIIEKLREYSKAHCFYGHYVSLLKQEVLETDLMQGVQVLTDEQADSPDIIDSHHYVFEPSLGEVTAFMESVMLEIALSQFIFDTQLSQFASRFNAMSSAKQKAKELHDQYNLQYHRAKRSESDGRLKEIINTLKAS